MQNHPLRSRKTRLRRSVARRGRDNRGASPAAVDSEVALFEAKSDRELRAFPRRSYTRSLNRRRELGRRPGWQGGSVWTPEHEALLGKMPDKEVKTGPENPRFNFTIPLQRLCASAPRREHPKTKQLHFESSDA
jgi:hypothetical protein